VAQEEVDVNEVRSLLEFRMVSGAVEVEFEVEVEVEVISPFTLECSILTFFDLATGAMVEEAVLSDDKGEDLRLLVFRP
jgi:hypothetical protein